MKCKVADLAIVYWIIISYSLCEMIGSNEPSIIILFIINAVFLGIYSISYAYIEIVRNKNYSLTALFVLFQFGLQASIGSVSMAFQLQRSNSGWYYLNQAILLSLIGCVCVRLSAQSGNVKRAGERLRKKLLNKNKSGARISLPITIILFTISTAVFLLCIRLGIYGYADSTNMTGYSSLASVAQYIIYLADLGSLLMFMCYYVALRDGSKNVSYICNIFIIVRVALALLSGMKKELIAIFVCLLIIFYVVRKRVSVTNIALVVGSVIVGYVVIDLYRSLLRGGDVFGGNRLNLLLQATSSSREIDSSNNSFYSFLSRLNIVEPCSKIIYYKKEVGLTSTDPKFLLDLVLLPLTIFIPRFLMPIKGSNGAYGLWVTHTVMGMPETILSSSYVTVQGCFYLAGGILCVIIGFLFLGWILEYSTGFLEDFNNPVLIGTFMMLTYKAIIEPATPTGMVTLIVRGLIIYTLFGMIALKARKDY